jgi:hypothetical protein
MTKQIQYFMQKNDPGLQPELVRELMEEGINTERALYEPETKFFS